MSEQIIKKIKQNPNFVKFCNRILTYNTIFEDEVSRCMFFASLMSADTLTDEQACDETIEIANFILNHIDLFVLEDNIKNDIRSKMESAIKIAERDKKEFFYDKIKKIIHNK